MEQTRRILLAEDVAAGAFITQRLLRQSGTEVDLLTARHGREALDIVREVCQSAHCPELILLDIHMPVLDGFGFLEELQILVTVVHGLNPTLHLNFSQAAELTGIGYKLKFIDTQLLYFFELPIVRESHQREAGIQINILHH